MSSPSLIGVFVDGNRAHAWSYDDVGEVRAHIAVEAHLTNDALDNVGHLKRALGDWLIAQSQESKMVVCGAMGGRVSTSTPRVPFVLDDIRRHLVSNMDVLLVPSLIQSNPPGYAEGLESLLFGIEQSNGLICAPLAITAHFTLEAGRVTDVSSEPTADYLSALLRKEREQTERLPPQLFSEPVFVDWVERSLNTDNTVSTLAASAAVRTGQLAPEHFECALNALLIGADIAAHYDPGDDVILIADETRLEMYGLALDAFGADVLEYSAKDCMSDALWEIAEIADLLSNESIHP